MRDYAVMANAAIRRYQMALILIIETTLADYRDTVEQRAAKKHQNLLTELLMEQLRADGLNDLLMMGAGLWKHVFCISSIHDSTNPAASRSFALSPPGSTCHLT